MKLWRISNYADLSGMGGLLFAGRWHSKGRPIIYTAEHSAAALLEMLVHMDWQTLPKTYQLLTLEVADSELETISLPSGWTQDQHRTRHIGDEWLSAAKSSLLRVPSALVPDSFNILINPRLAIAAKITQSQSVPLDERLRNH